jgi:hypothetical protein
MSHESLFFGFGIALAVSAVVVSLLGLRSEKFPGRAMPLVILWFAILIGCATTFAVLHGKDEQKARAAEYESAGREIEKLESDAPRSTAAGSASSSTAK